MEQIEISNRNTHRHSEESKQINRSSQSDEIDEIPADKNIASPIQMRSDAEDYADVEDNGEGFVSTGRNIEEYKSSAINFGVR